MLAREFLAYLITSEAVGIFENMDFRGATSPDGAGAIGEDSRRSIPERLWVVYNSRNRGGDTLRQGAVLSLIFILPRTFLWLAACEDLIPREIGSEYDCLCYPCFCRQS